MCRAFFGSPSAASADGKDKRGHSANKRAHSANKRGVPTSPKTIIILIISIIMITIIIIDTFIIIIITSFHVLSKRAASGCVPPALSEDRKQPWRRRTSSP